MKTKIWLSLILGMFLVQPSLVIASEEGGDTPPADAAGGDAPADATKKEGGDEAVKKEGDEAAKKEDGEAAKKEGGDEAAKKEDAPAEKKKPEGVSDECWTKMKEAAGDKKGDDCIKALTKPNKKISLEKIKGMFSSGKVKLKPVKELKEACGKKKDNPKFGDGVKALCASEDGAKGDAKPAADKKKGKKGKKEDTEE